jgi:hypothetical protein
MRIKITTAVAATLLLSSPLVAKKKEPAPCAVYFSVVETDELAVRLSMVGLNKPQHSWYEKHGDRDKFAGICYVAKASDAPADAPLYAVVWGEHLVSQPYTYTYQTQETVSGNVSGTVTDQSGNTSTVQGTTTTSVPVQHTSSGVSRYYVADGWLAVWDQKANEGKGLFVPIAPLHNHNRTKFTSASTSLLKDAMEQIEERERSRLIGSSFFRKPWKPE